MFARDAENQPKRDNNSDKSPQKSPPGFPDPERASARLGNQPGVGPRVESVTRTTISADLTIDGHVISKGEVQVDGDIKGSIRCAALVIGQNSSILGDIIAEDIVVRGRVLGSVHGARVQLQSTAHVEGDIHHQAIGIEQGAHFEGKSLRTENAVQKALANRESPHNA